MEDLKAYCKFFTIILLSWFIQACSVLVYTPVVVTAALGLNKTDLSEQPDYRALVGKSVRLETIEGLPWKLKKFENGRYYIERQVQHSMKRDICQLDVNTLIITEIFDDSVNGGRYFSATVFCHDKEFDAPLNHWSDEIKNNIRFSGLTKADIN